MNRAKPIRLYLDMSALKRPFDDRSQPRVDAEARAVLDLLERIASGEHELAWSTALTLENTADPNLEVLQVVAECARLATHNARLSDVVIERIRALVAVPLSTLDAAHLAFAEAASCDVLLTCDDRFLKRVARVCTPVRVRGPLQLQQELHDDRADD